MLALGLVACAILAWAIRQELRPIADFARAIESPTLALVSMPPRHAKTTTVRRALAYTIVTEPERREARLDVFDAVKGRDINIDDLPDLRDVDRDIDRRRGARMGGEKHEGHKRDSQAQHTGAEDRDRTTEQHQPHQHE